MIDHIVSLVKHYYEGDGKGGKPGWQQTDAQHKQFANDRSNMQKQSKNDADKQGGELSNYSKKRKKKMVCKLENG